MNRIRWFRISSASCLMALLISVWAWGVSCQMLPGQLSGARQPLVEDLQESDVARSLPAAVIPPEGYQRAVERGSRSLDGRPGEQYWQQFAEYEMVVTLHPAEQRLEALMQIIYHNRSPDVLREVHLELVQNFHAPGVVRNRPAQVTGGINFHRVGMLDGSDRPFSDLPEVPDSGPDRDPFRYNSPFESDSEVNSLFYSVQGTQMVIRLPEPLQPSGQVRLIFEYDFEIPQSGAGGRMGYHNDEVFFLGYWYPRLAVYDDVTGWHTDPYLGQAEFYQGFADYRMNIRVPENWLVMATGELMNPEEVLAPDVLKRWLKARQSDDPVRVYTAGAGEQATRQLAAESSDEFSGHSKRLGEGSRNYLNWKFEAKKVRDVAFSVTKNSHWDSARAPAGDSNSMGPARYTTINTFWREKAPLWEEVTAYQQHAIPFLSQLTGYPYPWPHMTAVEGGGIIGGGMEYPMITLMGDYNQRGAEALYSVTAHELAHMWIPLIVNTDERRYSWLDEGNTVFSTAEAVMDKLPERRPHIQAMNAYLRSARGRDEGPIMRRSDYHYSTQHFIVASYRKPSVVLVALRKVLGEDVFWEAYHTFINEWAFRHAYPWDFFRTFERISGQDLNWFWSGWYYETWRLDHEIATVTETDTGTLIEIRDRGEAYMPVWLHITLESGAGRKAFIPVDYWLKGKRSAQVHVPYHGIVKIELDPEYELPYLHRQSLVWQP